MAARQTTHPLVASWRHSSGHGDQTLGQRGNTAGTMQSGKRAMAIAAVLAAVAAKTQAKADVSAILAVRVTIRQQHNITARGSCMQQM